TRSPMRFRGHSDGSHVVGGGDEANRHDHAHGWTYAAAMLVDLRRRAERAGLAKIVTTEGDAHCLPFEDRTFDGANMITVLGEIPDPERTLRELRRVTRRRERPLLLLPRGPHAHAGDRRGCFLRLAFHAPVPQQPDLRVGHHRPHPSSGGTLARAVRTAPTARLIVADRHK